jgi:CRISPR system Cascade subunit CasD
MAPGAEGDGGGMTTVLLRFEAPMMSFGAARIDAHDRAGAIPTASMITGLFGCALGIPRRDGATLQAIQDAIRIAVAIERQGRVLEDYQTADLGKPFLRGPMWTVEGTAVERAGSAITETRQQWRQYVADGAVVAAVALGDDFPATLDDLAHAMEYPAHPLCIGRVTCPPAGMIWRGVDDGDMLDALNNAADAQEFYLPIPEYHAEIGDLLVTVNGRKNWRSDQHIGAETYIRRAA